MGSEPAKSSPLHAYTPRLLSDWEEDTAWRQVDGSLVLVDVSGFTNLSERLARRGRIGAEELTDVLNRVFGSMLELAYQRGGSLLKFGGDALLLLFEGLDHGVQAASAAVEMRASLREASRVPTSVGRIPLRMSVGVHSAPIDVFKVGASHQELVIAGSAATTTTAMEHAAAAGEILLSPATRALLPDGAAARPKDGGYLLSYRRAHATPVGITGRGTVDAARLARTVPRILAEHLASGPVDSEHRLATVAFVKYVGIDDAIATLGPELTAANLDRMVSIVQSAADEEDVTFLATDVDENGGKIILCVGVPGSKDDDEGRLVRATRAILNADPPFPVKIGINRGHVFAADIGTPFRRTFTVMGDTVNLAARLMTAAPPGSIYATPGVLDRSYTLFETEPLAPFMVKGKSAPVHAYRVGDQVGTRGRSSHRGSTLVGREREMAFIRTALAGLMDGRGSVVTVVGDTGVGKTRLVEESLEVVPDTPVVKLQAEPYGADNPYWMFRDVLRGLLGIQRADQSSMRTALADAVRRLDPGLEDLLPLVGDVVAIEVPDTEASRSIEPRYRPERTAAAVIRLFDVLFEGPLVIHADDIHWTDEASQGLLTRIVGVAGERPWLVIAGTRPEGSTRLGEVIVLGPLGDEDSMAIAVEGTRAAPLRTHELETVVAKAGGNPLFLEEILRLVRQSGGVEELPESLDAVMAAEIDTLRPHTRRLLRYCSVLGRSFRRVVLDGLLDDEDVGLDPATMRELARFVVVEGSDRLRFRHAVMQSAAYQGLSYKRRRQLHQRAGEVIERLAGDDPESVAEFLTIHYTIAGNADKAWHYSRTAGHRAQSTFANVEAEGHYRRALEAWARLSRPVAEEKVDVLTRLGDVREQAGMLDQALAAFREALSLTRGDARTSADLHLRCALVHMRAASYRAALAATTRARRLVEAGPSLESRRCLARVESAAAVVRMSQERPGEAEHLARTAISLAEEADEREALAKAYVVLDWALWMLGRSQQAVYGPEAMRIYESLGQPVQAASVMNNLGAYAYFDGRWDDAAEWYRLGVESYRRGGYESGAALARANSAEVLINQGHLDRAEVLIDDAVRVLVASGNDDDAMFALIQRARLWSDRGDVAAAIDEFEALLSKAREMKRNTTAVEIAIHLARAHLRAGDADAARRIVTDVSRHQPSGIHVPALALVQADLAARGGDFEAAIGCLESGLVAAADWGLVYESALLGAERISVLRAAGWGVDADDEAQVRATTRRLGLVGV